MKIHFKNLFKSQFKIFRKILIYDQKYSLSLIFMRITGFYCLFLQNFSSFYKIAI